MVSFAKGVSPPQRSALYNRPPQTLRLTQKKCLVRNTADLPASISYEYKRATQEKRTRARLSVQPHTAHTPSGDRCQNASSSNAGLSLSPVTCPAVCTLMATHGHRMASKPSHQTLKAKKKPREDSMTLVRKLLRGTRLDPRSVSKSSFKPTVRV